MEKVQGFMRALKCRECGREYPLAATHVCEFDFGPLEVLYDYDRIKESLTRSAIQSRPKAMWRYRELLPVADGPTVGLQVGFTPLIKADRLSKRLGIRELWIKNDTVNYPSLSFKDRVVATAINAAHALGLTTIGCASTGNLANAVAAHAARAGMTAWVFIPDDLEIGKIIGTAIYAPHLVRVRGHYDDVNRLCAQIADRFGWGIVNVNLRGYYGEGSKTIAFEIAEQLGWRLPTAVVAPMAGGSVVTKLRKGFGEVVSAELATGAPPRLFGAQAEGCAPIVRLFERGGDRIVPEVPNTIARSIAIGNPADGLFAVKAMRESGGGAQAVSDEALVAGIRLLAETTGIFTETAGGATVAAAQALADRGLLRSDDEVVLCITGNGLKTTEAVRDVLPQAPVIAAKVREVAALVEGGG